MPEVSVIIPNYNHAPYLEQRINSVLGQKYRDFELIIFDDASTDNSREVIEKYRGHPSVSHILYNTVNSGSTFEQWNLGVGLARAQYVWIAESDDVADENFLSVLVPVLDTNPSVGLAYCQSWRMNENGEPTGTWKTWTDDLDAEMFDHDFIMNGIQFIEHFLVHKNVIPNASAVLFRKNKYMQAGNARPGIRYSADWVMWLSILSDSDVFFVANAYNYFRYHQQSVIARALRQSENGLYVEHYSGRMRASLDTLISENEQKFRKIKKLNRKYLWMEKGNEGLFRVRKGQWVEGWKNLIDDFMHRPGLQFIGPALKHSVKQAVKSVLFRTKMYSRQ